MYKVGITGGIGTGKSTVSKVFGLLGIPVYDSDSAAKRLMNELPELVLQIKELFGKEAYTENGALNRQFLASAAFHNPSKLKELNALVHPQVKIDFEKWAGAQNSAPYVLKEAALIFEAGSDKQLNKVISILSPLELRIERLLKRDPHRTRKDLEAIMQKQLSPEEHRKLADFIVENDDRQLVIPQVLKVHEELLKLKEKG